MNNRPSMDKAYEAYIAHKDKPKPPLHERIAGVIYIVIIHLGMFSISATIGVLAAVQTLPMGVSLTNICGSHLFGIVVTAVVWRGLYIVYKRS